MKIRMATVAVAVLVAGGIVLASVRRQDEHGPRKPGKFHELLKQFEGNWETKSEFKMGPDMPAMKSWGTETGKCGVGGLCLISDVKSDMDGMAFDAHSVWGYDEHKKKYS